jgi:hypothetical protein
VTRRQRIGHIKFDKIIGHIQLHTNNSTYTQLHSNLFDTYNYTIKTSSKPPQENSPSRKQTPTPGPWALSNQEKADLFAEHLADVFTPNDATIDQAVSDYLAKNLETEASIRLLTPKEIKKEMSSNFHNRAS